MEGGSGEAMTTIIRYGFYDGQRKAFVDGNVYS